VDRRTAHSDRRNNLYRISTVWQTTTGAVLAYRQVEGAQQQHMRKTARLTVGVALLTTLTLGTGGTVLGAHCTETGMPGESYFGRVHVGSNNGPGGHNEGQHQGYASCDPSGRGNQPPLRK
jgi:hypothetical protein